MLLDASRPTRASAIAQISDIPDPELACRTEAT